MVLYFNGLGVLVYSTCTLSPQENEEMVDWFCNMYPKMELVALPSRFEKLLETKQDPFIPGLTRATQKCLRILPNQDYEGFFVAKFKKSDSE